MEKESEFYLDRLDLMVFQVLLTAFIKSARTEDFSRIAAEHWQTLKNHSVLLKDGKYKLTFNTHKLVHAHI